MPSLKNISLAYNVSCTNQPRNEEFKKILNLGIWEAEVALYRLLLEKPYDVLSISQKLILDALALEGVAGKAL